MPRADAADPPTRSRRARLGAFRARVRELPGGRIAWRLAVTVAGVAVVAIGIVLLPLPGPGWLIIFAGLGILASEYAWAARLLAWVRRRFVTWTQWLAAEPLWIRVAGVLLSLALIAGLALAAWFVTRGSGL
jgi:uncharacterized protein (TIGR02611 family)